MFEYLTGILTVKNPVSAVIECGGIGYLLSIPVSTYDRLPEIGQRVTILVHMVHRDDVMELYGFTGEFERELFRKLIGVTRIGPKLALAILSGGSPENLAFAIEAGDVVTLSKIPRLGKKTAERIIMELRGKLEISGDLPAVVGDAASQAVDALCALGFSRTDAARAIQKAQKKAPDALVDELIRLALTK